MYSATKIVSLILAFSVASFAAPTSTTSFASPDTRGVVSDAIIRLIGDVTSATENLDTLVSVQNIPIANIAKAIQASEQDAEEARTIIVSAVNGIDNQSRRAVRLQQLLTQITIGLRGNTNGIDAAPLSESFLGQLQGIINNPDRNSISGQAKVMGQSRNKVLPSITLFINIALEATDPTSNFKFRPIKFQPFIEY